MTVTNPVPFQIENPDRPSQGVRFAGLIGFVFAILQSACAAFLAISGFRVGIGLAALAAASGTYAPATGLHQDAIRIPMLIVGSAGALINLAVLIRVWRLRSRDSAHWRRRAISSKERRSERLQLILSVLSLVLIAAEVWTHPMMHKKRPAPVRTTLGSSSQGNSRLVADDLVSRPRPFLQHCVETPMEAFTEAGRNFEDAIIGHQDHDVPGGVHHGRTDLTMLEVSDDFRAQHIIHIAVNIRGDIVPNVFAVDLHARLPNSPRFLGA
jgi:hypothetical protein